MARVICTLQNASTLINGVIFLAHKLGMISEEIEQDVADAFLAIDGYLCHDEVKTQAIAAAAAVAAVVAAVVAEPPAAALAEPPAVPVIETTTETIPAAIAENSSVATKKTAANKRPS